MRILYLAHRIPYPPNKGDKIRSYHHVRYLARQHDVHLCAFFDEPEDARWAAALREMCGEVVLVPLARRPALVRGAWGLAAGRSLSEAYFYTAAMAEAVRRSGAGRRFDVAWSFSSVMAQYLPAAAAARRIADYVDVDSEKWAQFGAQSRGPLGWAYRLEAARLRAFEAAAAGAVDRVLFVSAAEAAVFQRHCAQAANVAVIGNGVDIEYFQNPAPLVPDGPPDLLFTGALDYRPNIEAVLYFARTVLPGVRRRYPGARLLVVGHRPAPRLHREAARQNGALVIAGSVPDVRPYFRGALVYVAPLRVGRGVQNKVLEAMAMRLPVVASPAAVEGLDVERGRHVVVADDETAWVEAVAGLIGDARRRRDLADAAAQLVRERYTWERTYPLLDDCLQPAPSMIDEGGRTAASS